MLCFFFFFFKQKTAYEVRISDWSSDVCSSDLLAALRSRVVTVINSCVALGLPCPGDAARRAVITHIDGHPYAMLVEGVEDVAVYDVQPLTSGVALDAGWRSIGTGLIELHGEPVLAIDLRALVPGLAAAA